MVRRGVWLGWSASALLAASCAAPRGKPAPATVTVRPAPADAGFSRASSDAGAHFGRLAPETIQRIVRDGYERFKRCYEAGLARNPKLEGKVVVRFVIARDGTVKSVRIEPGTDLPDTAAVACIVEGYKQLVFPRPSGGIVTVVYPIMFSPG